MSSVNDIGIRVSLIGGRQVATETLAVAGSIDNITVAASAATPAVTALAGGLDFLSTSLTSTTTMAATDNVAFTSLTATTRELMAQNDLLITSNDALLYSLGEVGTVSTADAASVGLFGRAMNVAGLDAAKMAGNVAIFGKYMGLAVVAAGAVVAYESMKMASTFSSTTASLSGNANITIAKAKDIGNAFISMSGRTEFSAQSMMSAFAPIAGQLSTITGRAYTTGQSLNFMTTATDLAEASQQDLTSTTASLSGVMQVYGFQANQARSVSNTLFNASRLTNVSFSQLGTVVSRLHSRLGQVIPSLHDTSSLLLDLAEHGAKGSRGTMVVVGAMNTLLGGGKTVDSMLNVLGLNWNTFIGPNGKFLGMKHAIEVLQPKLAELPQNLQLIAEKTLFGAGASQLMGKVVLAGAGAYDKASKSIGQQNTMMSAAQKQQKSVEGSIHVIDAAFHNLMLTIGNFLLPKLVGFTRWILQNKPVLIGLATAIGVVVVGAIAVYIASLSAATIQTAIFWIVLTGGTIIAVTAIVAGLVWLVTHWKRVWGDIKNWALDAWHFIDSLLHNKFVQSILLPIAPLLVLAMHWKTVWNGLKDIVSVVWRFLKPIFHDVAVGIHDIGAAVSKVGGFFGHIGQIFGFAEGGVVPGPQGAPMMALVHGGEVVIPPSNVYGSGGVSSQVLGMAASSVAPLGGNASIVSSQLTSNSVGGGGGGEQTIVLQLVVDRKVLAQAVYKQIANDFARR